MRIVEINQDNKQEFEEFLKSRKASLLQSFNWGRFQEALEKKTWQLVFFEENKIIASASVIKYSLPLDKSYLYCNRGPVIQAISYELQARVLKLLVEKIEEIAERENSIFFRIDPEWENKDENKKLLNNLGFKKSKKEVNPRNTLILNVSKSEEEILAQMHSKTRYNIRLSERKGVRVRISNFSSRGGSALGGQFPISNKNKDFEAFWKLMEETTRRDGFKSHPKEYYKKQLDFLGKDDLIKLFVAELNGKIISAIIVSFYGENSVYLHGASSYEHRKYMAPHLIQWEAIKEAKRRECSYYDFWGIEGENLEPKIKNQDWGGITRFKEGFAREFGVRKNYIGTWDYPIKKMWYGIYNLVRK